MVIIGKLGLYYKTYISLCAHNVHYIDVPPHTHRTNKDKGHRTQNTTNVKPDIKFIGYRITAKIIMTKLDEANTLKGSKPFPIKERNNIM